MIYQLLKIEAIIIFHHTYSCQETQYIKNEENVNENKSFNKQLEFDNIYHLGRNCLATVLILMFNVMLEVRYCMLSMYCSKLFICGIVVVISVF